MQAWFIYSQWAVKCLWVGKGSSRGRVRIGKEDAAMKGREDKRGESKRTEG